jgi:hypothetical protein
MSLISEVANGHHLMSSDRSTSTPGPFLVWNLSGSSLKIAGESKISEKDPERHLTRHPLSTLFDAMYSRSVAFDKSISILSAEPNKLKAYNFVSQTHA